jgi:methyl-accepting chemotaxis protein
MIDLWPKPTPTGLTEEEPKLSYVRRYQDWDWILGTGIYLDDAKAEIKDRIVESVKSMRYAKGTGYFWINDDTLPYPTMVMHPTVPSLDGQVLDNPDYENALGSKKNLFTAFVETTAASTGKDGFVDYLWPKPTPNGLTEETGKISYVRLHEPLGWIIGSGAYIDNIDAQVAENRKKIDDQVRGLILSSAFASLIFILIAIGLSYLFADSLAKPIQKLTNLANEISHGKGLDDKIDDVSRKDEIGELAKSIDRLKTSVRILMERARLRK